MDDLKNQLTVRGIIIGVLGCVVITAASAYTALKMGMLPWPIVFAALISLVFLRVFGSRSLNEANVTHTVMSAGAMVAGGLAFTIPGIWILGIGDVSFWEMLLIALAGVICGLIASACLRKQFIVEQSLEFPIGRAAAETLRAGDAGGSLGIKLFAAMGFSGIWTVLRDVVGIIPAMILNTLPIPGITFGIYMSPMMLSVGFLVSMAAIVALMAGAVVQLVLVGGLSAAGLVDVSVASAMNSSLGMGVMMGCGIAVVCKDVIPKGVRALKEAWQRSKAASEASESASEKTAVEKQQRRAGTLGLLGAVLAFILCKVVGLGVLPCIVVVLLSFVTVAMSAQSVGQTGIDPMEIFGLIVLLVVAALGTTPQIQLFFVAAIIAVACGLGGDVMNDFKAGAILGTSSRAQVIGQTIGGIIGAVVAAVALFALVGAYGPEAFGVGKEFVAAQANVVATLVSGIPNVPAFFAGLIIGFVIYVIGGPSMMIGLGIYLPVYMTFTTFLGCVVKILIERFLKARRAKKPQDPSYDPLVDQQNGLVIASGMLGGESIVGVCIAIAAVATGMSTLFLG